ncbi:MAG: glycosyltransferase family 2 protein [Ferruginibacter sp.]|nr:glycosyltransferase family 2 protein [Cytophagales bacterium]
MFSRLVVHLGGIPRGDPGGGPAAMNATKSNLAGVVVLYHPEPSVVENIRSYADDVDFLFIVDNSETPDVGLISRLRETFPRAEYISHGANLGIAKALNTGAESALARGYGWLLTMDQDSKAGTRMVPHLAAYLREANPADIGILTPQQLDVTTPEVDAATEAEEVATTMTSGNLLNLAAFRRVGKFEESFFIDYVDHEYCLRLREQGYRILQVNRAVLHHHLGKMRQYRVLGKSMVASHHNYVRRYYITRNRWQVMQRYKARFPEFYRKELKEFWREFYRILLFEEDKLRKVRSIVKGYVHFRKQRFGKL